jgi:hypothetical protein
MIPILSGLWAWWRRWWRWVVGVGGAALGVATLFKVRRRATAAADLRQAKIAEARVSHALDDTTELELQRKEIEALAAQETAAARAAAKTTEEAHRAIDADTDGSAVDAVLGKRPGAR